MRVRIVIPVACLLVASAAAYAATSWFAVCDAKHGFAGPWSQEYTTREGAEKGAAAHKSANPGHSVVITSGG